MDQYIVLKELGKEGIFTLGNLRRRFTVSFYGTAWTSLEDATLVKNHARIAIGMKHENVVKFLEWFVTGVSYYVVTEMCATGPLDKLLKETRHNIPLVKKFGADLVRGLEYLQFQEVIFGDWRPSKILVTHEGTLKYFDFSRSRYLNSDYLGELDDPSRIERNSIDGLPPACFSFLAPELFAGARASFASDIWGLACLLYNLLTGYTPFHASSTELLIHSIKNRKKYHGLDQCLDIPTVFINLMDLMLCKDPEKRCLLKAVMEHSFWKDHESDPICTSSQQEEWLPLDQTKEALVPVEATLTTQNYGEEDRSEASEVRMSTSFSLHASHTNQRKLSMVQEAVKTTTKTGPQSKTGNTGFTVRDLQNVFSDMFKFVSPNKTPDVVQAPEVKPVPEESIPAPPYDDKLFRLRRFLADQYAWGEDSVTLPHLLPGFLNDSSELTDLVLLRDQTRQSNESLTYNWLPAPMVNYSRLAKCPPQNTQAVAVLCRNFTPFTERSFRSASFSKVEAHLQELQELEKWMFKVDNVSKALFEFVVRYTFWLLTVTTSATTVSSGLLGRQSEEERIAGAGFSFMPGFLVASQHFLETLNGAPPALDLHDPAYWLVAMLMHRCVCHVIRLLNEALRRGLEKSEEELVFAQFLLDGVIEVIPTFLQVLDRAGSRTSWLVALGEMLSAGLCCQAVLLCPYFVGRIRRGANSASAPSSSTWVENVTRLKNLALDSPPNSSPPEVSPDQMDQLSLLALKNLVLMFFGCGLHRLDSTPIHDALFNERLVSSLWTCGFLHHLNSSNLGAKQADVASLVTGLVLGQPRLFLTGILRPSEGGPLVQALNLSITSQAMASMTRLQSSLMALLTVGLVTTPTCVEIVRILVDPRFQKIIFRLMDSPLPIVRGKAYLVSAAILAQKPVPALPLACKSRLSGCLSRDSNSAFAQSDPRQNPIRSISSYVAQCANHLHDVLARQVIPFVCERIANALGAPQWYQADAIGRPPLPRRSSIAANDSEIDRWLAAYSCVGCLLDKHNIFRDDLLLNPLLVEQCEAFATQPKDDEAAVSSSSARKTFCLIRFLGCLFKHWHSCDPITAVTGLPSVYTPSSLQNQVLGITLSLTEDIAQMYDVLQARKPHIVMHLLENLMLFSMGPATPPDIKATCFKIMSDILSVWREPDLNNCDSGMGATGMDSGTSDRWSLTDTPKLRYDVNVDKPRASSLVGLRQSKMEQAKVVVARQTSMHRHPTREDWNVIFERVKQLLLPYRTG